ncbi:MAG TPA: 2-oxoacid:acceptor oxidoreductase subunit alpha [Pseudolabrys sp.]|nr:2-oxoacid:acceptor oxidoreductase subunit alpha [Pseudolabrys sp.]
MPRKSISLVFAGSGGSGAMTAGAVLLRAAAHAGYYGMMSQLFGPQVRGGESASLLNLSVDPIQSEPDRFDLFVAIDWEKLDQFAAEIPLDDKSVIIADPDAGPVSAGIAKSKARVVALSMQDKTLTRLARALRGQHTNVFAAGAIAAALGIARAHVVAALEAVLGRKGAEVMALNTEALKAGYVVGSGLALDWRLAPAQPAQRWLISGNQALGLGALRGGVRFVGCYPITPATDLVEWLAPQLQKLGGSLVLAEDELASINMVLGASFGGVPAMTVTSGPGFSLMVEALGLAVAAEIPMVLIDVMRGGPSTGIPSKTEQSDINLAIYGGHGDAPRVVVAPMSIPDCINTTEEAVYLAESLQLPVIVLADAEFGQSRAVIDPSLDRPAPLKRRTAAPAGAAFKRYGLGGDPVTPMPPPGTPGLQWVADGLTHNEVGLPVSGAAAHVAQINKRAKKLGQFDPGDFWGGCWGEGDTAVVTFGSSIGPAREAAQRLAETGHPVRVIGLRVLAPLPAKALARALEGVRRVVVLEQNHGGQLYHYLLGQKAIPVAAESVARPGPLPFRPSEVASYLA